ncbi:Protein of unknown function [Meinhardsimonia xiamenensis]|jgi:hypothetical protein|uniref:DUF1523 domain-containing protein n=1 Tax=Meinhardsimonia xiamenensis TaxID=990712 RepID=A0A1G8YZ34_9RHOB|nr:DUF1523 family protein [Meinhardsimonia xiamenensis]PRX37493.1 uncharacterized protein DUF1523 [Meinhardsimonia xiamenensis]SDK08149.1 Protein of unknown function [Meinhardsimonia xiamenensis]
MRYVKWTLRIVVAVLVIAFLHYNLPQRDIVRITDTYEKRVDPGANAWFWAARESGSDPTVTSRDVFFIQAVRPNGKVIVYRNEDTGWGWPPYFKFDAATLQAEAADLRSTKDNPQWVIVTHYGWRNEFFSIYPNAISITPIDDPNVTLIPWFNIVLITLLLVIALTLRQLWRRFRRRHIDPLFEKADAALDEADQRFDRARGRLGRFIDRLLGRAPR